MAVRRPSPRLEPITRWRRRCYLCPSSFAPLQMPVDSASTPSASQRRPHDEAGGSCSYIDPSRRASAGGTEEHTASWIGVHEQNLGGGRARARACGLQGVKTILHHQHPGLATPGHILSLEGKTRGRTRMQLFARAWKEERLASRRAKPRSVFTDPSRAARPIAAGFPFGKGGQGGNPEAGTARATSVGAKSHAQPALKWSHATPRHVVTPR